eukprot:3304948-Amphidinium_carterae.1
MASDGCVNLSVCSPNLRIGSANTGLFKTQAMNSSSAQRIVCPITHTQRTPSSLGNLGLWPIIYHLHVHFAVFCRDVALRDVNCLTSSQGSMLRQLRNTSYAFLDASLAIAGPN